MITNKITTSMDDRKPILSTLWIFVVFNYIYADLAPMIFNGASQNAQPRMSDGLVFGFALFIESAIAMVFLSRVLAYTANRWANMIAGILHAAIISWTLVAAWPPPVPYAFSATMIIASALFIVWYTWTWPIPEAQR